MVGAITRKTINAEPCTQDDRTDPSRLRCILLQHAPYLLCGVHEVVCVGVVRVHEVVRGAHQQQALAREQRAVRLVLREPLLREMQNTIISHTGARPGRGRENDCGDSEAIEKQLLVLFCTMPHKRQLCMSAAPNNA